MSSNLPPGVNENMIPGNRPEDEFEEVFWEMVAEKAEAAKLLDLDLDSIMSGESMGIWKLLNVVREVAWEFAYREGLAEGELVAAEKWAPDPDA